MFCLNLLLCVYLLEYGVGTPAPSEDSRLVALSGLDVLGDFGHGDDYIEDKFSENQISSSTFISARKIKVLHLG